MELRGEAAWPCVPFSLLKPVEEHTSVHGDLALQTILILSSRAARTCLAANIILCIVQVLYGAASPGSLSLFTVF
jgi:hypothetical protein